jgi:hypothetical protein
VCERFFIAANIDMPSNSTSKSNHNNAPLHIQTANSPNSSLNHWEITQADQLNKTQHLNTLYSQENTDSDPMFGLHRRNDRNKFFSGRGVLCAL